MPPKPRSSSEDMDEAMSELREIKSAVYPLALKVHQIDDKVSEMKKDVDSQLSSITDQVDEMKQDVNSQLSSITDQFDDLKQDVNSKLASITAKVDKMQKNIDSKLADAITKITDEIKKSLESITGITATKSDDIKKAIDSKLANTTSAIEGLKEDIDSKLATTASKIDELKKDIDPKLADTVSKINGVTNGVKTDIDSKLINVTSKVDKIDSEVAKLGAVSDATNKSITLLEALDVKGPRMGNFFCHWDVGDLHHVFEIKLFDNRSPEAVNWFRRLNFFSLDWDAVVGVAGPDSSIFAFRIDLHGLAKKDWFRNFLADSSELQRRNNVVQAFSDVNNPVTLLKNHNDDTLYIQITPFLRTPSTDWDFVVIGQVVNYDKESLHEHGTRMLAPATRGSRSSRSRVSKDRPFQWY